MLRRVLFPRYTRPPLSPPFPATCAPISTSPPPEIVSAVDALFSRTVHPPALLKSARASPLLSSFLQDRDNTRRLAEAMALSRDPHRSHQLLSLAHRLGCNLKQNAYECVSFQLAAVRHWNMVLSIVALGQHHTGRTTVRLLNWRARALAETHHHTLLDGILDEFKHFHLLPTRRTFHLLLSSHIRNSNLARAKQCLRVMDEAGFPADASTHAIVATSSRSLGADPLVKARALDALPDMLPSTATSVVNHLIQLHLDAHNLSGVFQMLSLFGQTTSDAIRVVIDPQGEIHSDTLQLPIPIIPNAATFSLFINYLATQSDLTAAQRVFQIMIAMRIQPTAGTNISLIHTYFAAGRPEYAVRLVAEMCDPQKTPWRMFQPLLPASADTEPVLAHSALPPTVRVFNALLRGVLPTHGLNCIKVVLRLMRAHDIQPNAATLEILIAHADKVEHARPRHLLRILRGFSSPTLRPTLRHMHLILSCVLRHEKYLLYGRGWNVIAARFSPRSTTIQRPLGEHRISSIARSLDPTAGIKLPPQLSVVTPIVDSLSARQIRSDGASFALRIRHDAVMKSDMDSAQQVFHTLLARGIHPNEYHFSALIEGFVLSGDLKAATDVIKSAERVGVKPNVVMFTILIVGYARQGNPDMAIRTFQQMVTSGIKPDVPAIDAVSSAFFAVGAYTMARRVLTTLWSHIQPFPKELQGAPLKDLTRHFRLLHKDNQMASVSLVLSKQRRLMLHRKLRDLMEAWHAGGGPKRPSHVKPHVHKFTKT